MVTRYYYKKNTGKELLNLTMPIEDYALQQGWQDFDATEYTQLTEEEYNEILEEWKSESGTGGIKASTVKIEPVISVANNGIADDVQTALQYLSFFTSQTDQNLQEMDRKVEDLCDANEKRIDNLEQTVDDNYTEQEQRIDTISGLTVDKIDEMDGFIYGASGIEYDDESGIAWHDRAEFYDYNGRNIGAFNITKHIPIVAGDNITFDVEDDIVKINSTASGGTGGSVKLYKHDITCNVVHNGMQVTLKFSALNDDPIPYSDFHIFSVTPYYSSSSLISPIALTHCQGAGNYVVYKVNQGAYDVYAVLMTSLTLSDDVVELSAGSSSGSDCTDCVKQDEVDDIVLDVITGQKGSIDEEQKASIREFLGISIYDGEVVEE